MEFAPGPADIAGEYVDRWLLAAENREVMPIDDVKVHGSTGVWLTPERVGGTSRLRLGRKPAQGRAK
jgi:hypothetical protein